MLSMEFADARPAVGREEIKMHYRPVKLSVEGRSCQLGRANAPMIPQLVQTMARAKGRRRYVVAKAIQVQHGIVVA